MFPWAKKIIFTAAYLVTMGAILKEKYSMRLIVFILQILGIWPPETGIKRYFYFIHTFVITSVQVTLLIAEIWGLFYYWGDIDKVTMDICILLPMVCSIFKVIMIVIHQTDLCHLIASVEDLVEKQKRRTRDEVVLKMLDAAESNANLKGGGYLTYVFITNTIWNMLPLMQQAADPNKDRSLPIVTRYPYDDLVDPHYQITYALQVYGSVLCALIVIAVDVFFCTILIHIRAHLRILNLRLSRLNENVGVEEVGDTSDEEDEREVKSDSPSAQHPKGVRPDNDTQRYERMYHVLRKCVKSHQTILAFVDRVEENMNRMVLAQFLMNVLIICVTLFQCVESTSSSETTVKCILYLFAIIFEQFIYCWYAHYVTEESELVSQAAYSGNWFSAPPKFKRSIRIIMSRAQKPATLTAGKFYPITKETFVSMINASYSYYTLLRQFNSR